MTKLTKNQKLVLAKVEPGKTYKLNEAAELLKDITFTKFDASVDVDVRLGVDPRKANQMVRGVVTLPHGTGFDNDAIVDRAITVIPATEALLHTANRLSSSSIVDRYTTLRTQTPQSLRLSLLSELHREAAQKDIRNSVATCTLLIELGHEVHFANGDNANFKITTESDIRLLDAYLKCRKMVPWREP